jgi:hypothetical protein
MAETYDKGAMKNWLTTIVLHDVAEKMNICRAGQAKGFGLSLEQFARPFPGTTSNVTIQQQTEPAKSGAAISGMARLLVAAILSAVLACPVGGAIGAGLAWWLLRGTRPASQPAEGVAKIQVFWGDEEIVPNKPAEANVPAQ